MTAARIARYVERIGPCARDDRLAALEPRCARASAFIEEGVPRQ